MRKIDRHWSRFVLNLLVLGSLLFLEQSASLLAQAPPPNVIVVEANGTECFRDLLNDAGLNPLKNSQDLMQNPRDSIWIIFGSTAWMDNNSAVVQQYLSAGGSVLICSDRASTQGMSNVFNLKINGSRIQDQKKDHCYLGDPALPYVQPFFGLPKNLDVQSPRSIFLSEAFLQGKVACNLPSAIRHGPALLNKRQTIEDLAGFPESAKFANGQKVTQEDFFAVGGSYGAGRYLVLADQDVFINIMLARADLANKDFAATTIRWLQVGDREPRKRCLFFEDGRVVSQFDTLMNLDPSKRKLPWHVYLNYILDQQMNPLIAEMEQKDVFNKILLNKFGYRPLLRALVFGLMGIVLLYGFVWMWKHRFKVDHSIHEATKVVGRIPRGGALQQRQEALLECGSLYEAFRLRVRERFIALGGMPNAAGEMPLIEIDDSVNDPRGLRNQIVDLWEIAFDRKVVVIKAEEWDPRMRRLRNLYEDAQDGRWQFEPHSSTT